MLLRIPLLRTRLSRYATQRCRFNSTKSTPASDEVASALHSMPALMAEVLAAKEAVNPSKATWLDALREREKQLAQGVVLDSYSFNDPKTYDVLRITSGCVTPTSTPLAGCVSVNCSRTWMPLLAVSLTATVLPRSR